MAELPAIISVHAQFPKNVVPNTEHDLDPTNWEWEKCLAFPVNRLNDLRFSLKPYKWIRYATGIIIGARGELCTERNLSLLLASPSYPLTYITIPPTKRSAICFQLIPNLPTQ